MKKLLLCLLIFLFGGISSYAQTCSTAGGFATATGPLTQSVGSSNCFDRAFSIGDNVTLSGLVIGGQYTIETCGETGPSNHPAPYDSYIGIWDAAGSVFITESLGGTCGDGNDESLTFTATATSHLAILRSESCGTGFQLHDLCITYLGAPCTNPTVPTINSTPGTICAGNSALLTISGTLNDATQWSVYTGSCGGTLLGTTTGSTIIVTPTPPSTTYFVRGEGGCVTPGSCGTVTVTTTPLEDATFSYSAASYCANASDPTPTITGVVGGTFSSGAGLSINASTGTIDVSASTPGIYTVTYTTSGSCPNSSSVSVTINALDNASFNYSAAAYCSNASDPTPTITGLAGGTFTSGAGLAINTSTGTVDVSASTPGMYTVTYTTAGACPNSSSVSVTINLLDNASFNYNAASYCVNASDPTPTITGVAGGTFSSGAGLSINASTGTIDVSASTPGIYTVTYTTSGSCPNSSSVSVTINALDNASFNYSAAAYCSNASDPTPTITGLAGGTFNSGAGLAINTSTGTVDVSASIPGMYTVTYTTAGACSNSSNFSVTVNLLDNASFNYSAATYCISGVDPTPTITGLAGGTFSSTAGLAINAGTGVIDLSASTLGTYVVMYTTAGSCPNSSNVSVTINALDDASFNYSAAAYCLGDSDPTPTITGLAGGTFSSSPAGLNINSSTGFVNIGLSAPGAYTVTYTTAGSCSNASNVALAIGTPPASPTTVSPITSCPGADVILSATGSGTGSLLFFDNTPTLIGTVPMPPATGTLNVGVLPVGSYTFSVSESNGTCSSLPTPITVSVSDNTVPTPICQNITIYLDGSGNTTITAADIDGGSTDNCGGVTFGASQTSFTCADIGDNNVILTITDASLNINQCMSTVTVLDTVSPVAICQDVTVQLGDMGTGSIAASDIDNESADNCGILNLEVSTEDFSCDDVGSNPVVLTVTDVNSNVNTCSATVTVEDNILPTISCVNSTISFNGEDELGLEAANMVTATNDNCGVASVTYDPATVTTAQIGETITVTATVTDVNGNTAQCSADVSVSGLPDGWVQDPDGVNCTEGNYGEHDFDTDEFILNSTNCYYSSPFNSDQTAFIQRTLCGNGSITVEVTGITGGLGWAGVVMRENNSAGARKIQLSTNTNSNFSRREVRTVTNGPAMPQQFPSFNRHWLRIVRQGNFFIGYTSPNGINWFQVMAANINMGSCVEMGMFVTNYNQNGTVVATFGNVSFTEPQPTTPPFSDHIAATVQNDYEIYPNPASEGIFLDLKGYTGKPVSIEMHNMSGQLIKYLELDLDRNATQYIDMIGQAPGLYIVKVRSDQHEDVIKRFVLTAN